MRKMILPAVVALLLCLSLTLCVQAASAAIFDEADLLTDSEEMALSETLEAISEKYETQIAVATVASADGKDPDDLTREFYRSRNLGYGENSDGVLLLICMDPRQYRILSMGSAEAAIDSGEISAIGDEIQPDLSAGSYMAAMETYARLSGKYLDGQINGYPFRFLKNLMISLAVGLIVGLITALVLKGQLKTVRKQNQADVYVRQGSMNLTVCNDLFLYRNVTRIKKPSNNSSSSGSRSSGNIGGGRF